MGNGPHREIKVAETPLSRNWEQITRGSHVTPDDGLSSADVRSRRRRFGANRLRAGDQRSSWSILLDQIQNLIILLLAVAAGVSFTFAQWLDGVAIGIAILLNVAFGFVTELRATRSMEALQRMSRVSTRVRRCSRENRIPSEKLVPGDIVDIEGGDIVPADMVLKDDAFDTIVTAIQQGRTIFENIRKLDGCMLIIGFSLLPLIIGQALKAVYRAVKSREELQKTITEPAS